MDTSDTVGCMVCGRRMTMINNRHLASHDMTAADYKLRFPDAPLKTEAMSQKLSQRSVNSNAERKGKPRSSDDLLAIRSGVAKRPSRKGVTLGPRAPEHCAKLSDSISKSWNNRVHHNLGKSLPEETKKKISESLAGRVVGPESALKAVETKRRNGHDFGASMRGRTLSEETKRKIGEKSKKTLEEKTHTRAYMVERIEASKLRLLNSVTENIFELQCLECGYEFTRWSNNFVTSKWSPEVCDQCHPISPVSGAEKEIALYCESIIPIVRSDMEQIAPLELDIYVPALGLAVEYCGIYWHSELAGKTRWYHRKKMELCRDKNIKLVTIFEDEWLNKPEIVRSVLSNHLGVTSKKIGARKCQIVELDSPAANAFLEENHLQGRGRSKKRYGLMFENELVAVMTFMDSELSRRRSGWEINRFAVKLGCSIPGGASRLYSHFLNDCDPDHVISYADLRWGNGAVYGKLGFERLGDTVPNYWYFKPNEMKRYHRYGLRKKVDEPKERTEWELRQEQGWNRIWDCGHAKWEWIKK